MSIGKIIDICINIIRLQKKDEISLLNISTINHSIEKSKIFLHKPIIL